MAFPHFGAFESTKLLGSRTDILGTTRHIQRWRHDLELLNKSGLSDLRYSVPWHRIEREPGIYDFEWMDRPMGFMREANMHPVLDTIHHVSFPDWLTDGFANPDFPELYQRFVLAVARRYEWTDRYTVFNEPLPTTLFCSLTGLWYPNHASDRQFVAMATNVGRAICQTSSALRKHNPQIRLYHVDTCEAHAALDQKSVAAVSFANHRRFLMHDLILGRINSSHPLYRYLLKHGFEAGDMQWFWDHPAAFDVLGLDYYAHCEMDWYWDVQLKRANIARRPHTPLGFAAVADAYANRFQVPVMLAETNLRGTVLDRLTWLKFMEEQCELLASRQDFRGFCWYPSIDSTDWCHLCKQATGTVDPQGIWALDDNRWDRHASELSEYYVLLAKGNISSADLPAYTFSSDAECMMTGYQNLMEHWSDWQPQREQEAA